MRSRSCIHDWLLYWLSNSYTIDCPHVRGDNPRALASGLSCVHVDRHGTCITFYTTFINVYLAHHEIFHAKVVGKGGIMRDTYCLPLAKVDENVEFILKCSFTQPHYSLLSLLYGPKRRFESSRKDRFLDPEQNGVKYLFIKTMIKRIYCFHSDIVLVCHSE